MARYASDHDRACLPDLGIGADPLQLFTEGDRLYNAMLIDIGKARSDISLVCYIFGDDPVGWRFAEALAERVKAGVTVRVQLDAVGTPPVWSRKLRAYLSQHGIELRYFHRWQWRDPFRFNRRDHRKLLVVDSDVAYLGGFNIHQESSRTYYDDERWLDAHVRFEGYLARWARSIIEAVWWPRHTASPPPSNDGLRSSALVPTSSPGCRQQLRWAYLDLFRRARKRLYLATPYFVPDPVTRRSLMTCAERGVDVHVLLPAVSDVPLARWAARAEYGRLLEAGVRVFEYGPRLLHTKAVVADGAYASVGTANLDVRSFFLNEELNLFTRSPDFCHTLEAHLLACESEAAEVDLGQWQKRGRLSRVAESAAWLLRYWL